MHRLPAETDALGNDVAALSREAAVHLRALRPEKGERFELFDGKGAWRVYEYDGASLVAAGPVQRRARPETRLALFACITKGSRWDWTIEKATELGADLVVPVVSARTIVRIGSGEAQAKLARWRRIAEDAARQSDAKWTPEILPATDFRKAAELSSKYMTFAGAITVPPAPPLLEAVAAARPQAGATLAAFIGPEGDFTPDELEELLKTAVPASFGPSVLRAETAAIYAMSVLSAARDAMKEGKTWNL